VASLEPNALGLYDMHGNVAEWTAGTYHDLYDLPDAPVVDPRAGAPGDPLFDPERKCRRMIRGGSYQRWLIDTRSARRQEVPTSLPGLFWPYDDEYY
jgi:formylglycine-generating enzyme required for sulfatase activity